MTQMNHIVLMGPPLVGKTSLLLRFAATYDVAVEKFAIQVPGLGVPGGVGVRLAGTIAARPFVFSTLGGAVWELTVWAQLLQDSTAVGLVFDGQPSRRDANLDFLRDASRFDALPEWGCVIYTKQDLVEAEDADQATVDLSGTVFHDWRMFRTAFDSVSGAISPLDYLLSGRDP